MFRDVRECLDAGNRLHTLLASQKPSRKSIPILIDVEQGICNGSLGIFKNSIQQYIIFVYSFFLKKYYQKSKTTSCKILSKIYQQTNVSIMRTTIMLLSNILKCSILMNMFVVNY